MVTTMWLLLVASPCVQATPLQVGTTAPCTGVLLAPHQVKQALEDRKEAKLRRMFKCPECPACAPCVHPPKPNVVTWALGGFVGGVIITTVLAHTL